MGGCAAGPPAGARGPPPRRKAHSLPPQSCMPSRTRARWPGIVRGAPRHGIRHEPYPFERCPAAPQDGRRGTSWGATAIRYSGRGSSAARRSTISAGMVAAFARAGEFRLVSARCRRCVAPISLGPVEFHASAAPSVPERTVCASHRLSRANFTCASRKTETTHCCSRPVQLPLPRCAALGRSSREPMSRSGCS